MSEVSGQVSKRSIPRYQRVQAPKSFWAPGLDDKTKYMMRLNNLVVGFVWKTAEDGTVYLSGTKVERAYPESTIKPRKMYSEEVLKNFVFIVESKPEVASVPDRAPSTTVGAGKTSGKSQVLHRPAHDDQDGVLENKKSELKRPQDGEPLTSKRYALYRYFILRCQSRFHLYYANTRILEAGRLLDSTKTQRRKAASSQTLTLTQARSSCLARLRTRLKVCRSIAGTSQQQLLEIMSSGESFIDSDNSNLNTQLDPAAVGVKKSKNTRVNSEGFMSRVNLRESDSSDSDQSENIGDITEPAYRKTGLKGRKVLKVKRMREKLKLERQQWGYDDESEEEASRQRSQMRARRYQYLKSAKLSKLHKESNPGTSTTTADVSPQPQVISIGDDMQAFSWEVPMSIDDDASDFFRKHQFME